MAKKDRLKKGFSTAMGARLIIKQIKKQTMKKDTLIQDIKNFIKLTLSKFLVIPRKDFLAHLFAGMWIYLYAIKYMPLEYAMLAVLLIGIAKEVIWDKMLGKGTPEVADVVFTAIGGASALILTM